MDEQANGSQTSAVEAAQAVEDAGMTHAELTTAATAIARDSGSFLEMPLDTALWPDDEMSPDDEAILVTRLRELEVQAA